MRALVCSMFLTLAVASACQAAAPLKVGVYRRGIGAAATGKALARLPGLKVSTVREIDHAALEPCDVLLVGAGSIDQPAQIRALRAFVACGGGLVFSHQSCGRGRPQTLFPAVAKRVIDRREHDRVRIKDRAHPVAAGVPAEFQHSYYDHLYLEPGPEGQVVAVDHEGAAVLVAGRVGPGRVVFNGCLPGYRYDPATFAQSEVEPAGGELALVAGAVAWAGQARASTLAAEDRAKRRAQAEADMKLEELSALLPRPDWFGAEMLQGSYLPPQPVGELGGRFFITYDSQTWRGYKLSRVDRPEELETVRQRLALDVRQLKWLGVTDIIYWTDASGERVFHPSGVPDMQTQCRGVDQLAELVRAATPEGLNVWASWHSCARSAAFAKKYCAKDAEGKFYKYGGEDFCEDLLSGAYRRRCHDLLDEYAAKYKPLGNFLGLAIYDELWFNYADFHADDLAVFAEFCTRRFGEKLPADMPARLALRTKWTDPGDVWRRRYILFKQHVMTEFWRDLVQYAHQKKLQIGVQLLDTAHYPSGWCWGMDSVALARLGADFLNTGAGETGAGSYPNTLRWGHISGSWGFYNTHCLRGGPGGIYFTFNQLWRLVMYANNPGQPAQLARHIHNQRQWAGAEPLARTALLHNQNALQMLLADPRAEIQRHVALLGELQRSQDLEVIFTQATERYAAFRTLVAAGYSVRGLSADVLAGLRDFAAQGGTIISLNADWSTSRDDLSAERDVTDQIVGVRYGPAGAGPFGLRMGETSVRLAPQTPRRKAVALPGTEVVAAMDDGSPAITRRTLGKGQVLGLHFSADAEFERAENPALTACLGRLVARAARPEVTAEGRGFRLISALKKGNWVAVALYPDEVPAKVRLRVDLPALGIAKNRFRLAMLGKQMEIGRPGDLFGQTGFWSAEELRRGFPVTIVADDDAHKPLPESFDLSAFEGKRSARDAQYIDTVTRTWWDSPTRGRIKRQYAHEIVVLAPADEPVMPRP